MAIPLAVAGVGLLAVIGVLVVTFLAVTGGLRLNSPTDEMRTLVEEFNTESFVVIGEETVEDRVCFLQCTNFSYSQFLQAEPGTDTSCGALEQRASEWLGKAVRMTIREDPEPWESRCFASAWVSGEDRWRAFVANVGGSSQFPRGTDWEVRVVELS